MQLWHFPIINKRLDQLIVLGKWIHAQLPKGHVTLEAYIDVHELHLDMV